MADYFQNGAITTLHRLGQESLGSLEARLARYAETNPIALVLPCLVRELDGPALPSIVRELAEVPYLDQIVVALGRADHAQYRRALEFFGPLGSRCRILWIESPSIQQRIAQLADNGLDIGPPGKGRATWLALGYVLARNRARVIALHDCDILTYDRFLPARLCYPVTDASLGYEYAKGYYPRVTDQLNGRATRLFLTPLIRALQKVVGHVPLLTYLDSFRYPLAGEFALHADLARSVRIPGDWGLEVGMLYEIYRNTSVRRVCQVDIADNYEHKHQPLSQEDATTGLNRMARDIAQTLLRSLAMEGIVFPAGFYTTLRVSYLRAAQDAVRAYHDVARINRLKYDRHTETVAVETFAHALAEASREFEANPMAYAGLPNWNRVASAIPEFLGDFHDAVESAA